MKIIFISPSFYPAFYYGGPIYSSYELAKALKKQSFDIKVITTNANGKEKLKVKTGTFQKLENYLPVKYYRSLDSRGTSLSMFFNLYRDIKKSEIIYLISIFSPTTPITIILCKFYKKPLIVTPKGQIDKWCLAQGNRLKKLWLRFFIEPFIENIYWHSTSAEEQKDINEVYPTAKSFLLPHGINLANFSNNKLPKERSFFNKYTAFDCTQSKIIISMGRIHKKKGYDILIKSLDLLLKQNLECLLFIAGDNFGAKSELQMLIESYSLSDIVFFTGYLEGEEKINFLHNADVFALPSHDENFGIVYAEALAAGTPIIASRHTPWKEVEKYNCGKWVENKPELFAKSIIEILNSDPVKMGKNGRNYVEENYSWDKIAVEFKDQIQRITLENNESN